MNTAAAVQDNFPPPPLAPPAKQRFANVNLVDIFESPTNPRQHFDEAKLNELAASITENGVIEPLIVRDCTDRPGRAYELINGARRYRAATLAGLSCVPVLILQLDDDRTLELQSIVNLQREDIHPLDEAIGYQRLLQRPTYDVASIAARIGKSEAYVYQRLALLRLNDDAREAFWAEKINASMATAIAKLQPTEQKEAMRRHNLGYFRSTRELTDWIQREIYLDLHKVPFPKGDAELLPAAGSCDACSKRTGFTPALFPEVAKSDTCTDPKCFNQKIAAFVEIKRAEIRNSPDVGEVSGEYHGGAAGLPNRNQYDEITPKEAKQLPDAKKVLVVDGEKAGHVIWIQPTNRPAAGMLTEEEKKAEQQRKRDQHVKAETLDRCLDQLLNQVKLPLPDPLLKVLCIQSLDRLTKDGLKRLAASWHVQAIKSKNQWGGSSIDVENPLRNHIFQMGTRQAVMAALIDISCRNRFSGEPDPSLFAEWYPQDAKAIERQVRDELSATKKRPAAPAKKAATKKGKA